MSLPHNMEDNLLILPENNGIIGYIVNSWDSIKDKGDILC